MAPQTIGPREAGLRQLRERKAEAAKAALLKAATTLPRKKKVVEIKRKTKRGRSK